MDSVDSAATNETVCDILNTFSDEIRGLLNDKASALGIGLSSLYFEMNGSKIRAVAQVYGVLDAVNGAASDFGLRFSDITVLE